MPLPSTAILWHVLLHCLDQMQQIFMHATRNDDVIRRPICTYKFISITTWSAYTFTKRNRQKSYHWPPDVSRTKQDGLIGTHANKVDTHLKLGSPNEWLSMLDWRRRGEYFKEGKKMDWLQVCPIFFWFTRLLVLAENLSSVTGLNTVTATMADDLGAFSSSIPVPGPNVKLSIC